jgi:hypothetical protein
MNQKVYLENPFIKTDTVNGYDRHNSSIVSYNSFIVSCKISEAEIIFEKQVEGFKGIPNGFMGYVMHQKYCISSIIESKNEGVAM